MTVEVAAAKRRFTREEYHRMAEVGILKPTDRVELIRGEIVEMSPPGRRHVAFVNNLNQLPVTRLAGRAIVSVQNPVVLADDTEPQPDLAVVRRRAVPYKEAEIAPDDVLLLIEVAESSLAYDRSTKLRLYAHASVAEYWVVDGRGAPHARGRRLSGRESPRRERDGQSRRLPRRRPDARRDLRVARAVRRGAASAPRALRERLAVSLPVRDGPERLALLAGPTRIGIGQVTRAVGPDVDDPRR